VGKANSFAEWTPIGRNGDQKKKLGTGAGGMAREIQVAPHEPGQGKNMSVYWEIANKTSLQLMHVPEALFHSHSAKGYKEYSVGNHLGGNDKRKGRGTDLRRMSRGDWCRESRYIQTFPLKPIIGLGNSEIGENSRAVQVNANA